MHSYSNATTISFISPFIAISNNLFNPLRSITYKKSNNLQKIKLLIKNKKSAPSGVFIVKKSNNL